VKHTGRKLSEIEQGMERDNFMSASEAQKFGLIDEVVLERSDLPGAKDDKKK